MSNPIKRSRIKFYLLLFIFIFPVMGSSLLYHFRDHFHFKTTNLGVLVNPAIDVNHIWDTCTQRRWRIVHVSSKQCGESCKAITDQLHQLQIALGKDHERVCILESPEALSKLSIAFEKKGDKPFIASDKIYLVDPNGNLFMYYPNSINLMNILKDMKKVLKASQIG